MANGQLGSYDVERRQEGRTAGPGELMVLVAPDAGALFVWRQFTESGPTAVGDILHRLPEGTGELAGARDDPARRTLRMAQVARGEAVNRIVFTSVHGGGGSPVAAALLYLTALWWQSLGRTLPLSGRRPMNRSYLSRSLMTVAGCFGRVWQRNVPAGTCRITGQLIRWAGC